MKKKLQMLLWVGLGAATLVLFAFAVQKSKHAQLTGIKIDIEGADQHVFADEGQITQVLKSNGVATGTDPATLDLHSLEHLIEQNAWIKKADLYIDSKHVLQVGLYEREAVARVFALNGNSFYIDSSLKRLPINNNLNANVPVFTSFPTDKPTLSIADSALLGQVKTLAIFIQNDSIWQAQIAQVDVMPDATFEMIPTLGDHIIAIGNTDSLQQKFDRLMSFYKHVWGKYGMEKYERVDVQYANQVVATQRGHYKAYVDSARARQVLDASLTVMHERNIGDSFKAEHVSPAERRDDSALKQTADKLLKKEKEAKTAEKKAEVKATEKKAADKKADDKKAAENKADKKEADKKAAEKKEAEKKAADKKADDKKAADKKEANKKEAVKTSDKKDVKPVKKREPKKGAKAKTVSENDYSL